MSDSNKTTVKATEGQLVVHTDFKGVQSDAVLKALAPEDNLADVEVHTPDGKRFLQNIGYSKEPGAGNSWSLPQDDTSKTSDTSKSNSSK